MALSPPLAIGFSSPADPDSPFAELDISRGGPAAATRLQQPAIGPPLKALPRPPQLSPSMVSRGPKSSPTQEQPTQEQLLRDIQAEAAAKGAEMRQLRDAKDRAQGEIEAENQARVEADRIEFRRELDEILKIGGKELGKDIDDLCDRHGRNYDEVLRRKIWKVLKQSGGRMSREDKVRMMRLRGMPEAGILDFLANELNHNLYARNGLQSEDEVRVTAARLLLRMKVGKENGSVAPGATSPAQPLNRRGQPRKSTWKPPASALTIATSHSRLARGCRPAILTLSRRGSVMRFWSLPPALTLGLALTGLLSCPSLLPSQEPEASLKVGTRLLLEGDKLADQGKPSEAVIRYKTAFEHILPSLRQIPFKHEVKRDVTRREQLKTLLLKEFDEDQTPEEFRASEMAMKAFGLIPRSVDLKPLLVQVYSEEIAAFYDPKTKTMHLIEEPEAKTKEQPTLLERILGKKSGFDKDENKTVIAHELTHALADQHYDLDKLHHDAHDNDDRSLAISALIEGEATLAMMGAGMEDWNGSKIITFPAADLDRSLSMVSPFLSFIGGGKTSAHRAGDHHPNHDLPVFPRHGFLCGPGQRRGLEGRGRSLSQPAGLDRAGDSSREVPRQARPAYGN